MSSPGPALLLLSVLVTAALPPPPSTPPAVTATEGFGPGSQWLEAPERPLYPILRAWPARGATSWRLGPGSSATLEFSLDGHRVRRSLGLQGQLLMDAARPEEASGELRLILPEGLGGALDALRVAQTIRPAFTALGSLPRGDLEPSAWAWRMGGQEVPGRVLLGHPDADRVELRGEGGLPIDRSAPRYSAAREAFGRALGGGMVGEELALVLDLQLTR